MTTVGYGDKAPRTVLGRAVGLLLMLVGIVLISFFTAAVTSMLTVSQLESAVKGPEDLPRLRVGTLPGSTSERYLKANRIGHTTYPGVLEAMQALAKRRIDAVVYDIPMLRYIAATELKGKVRVLPHIVHREDLGIGLRNGSPLRKPINRVLLKHLDQTSWRDTLFRYLGKE